VEETGDRIQIEELTLPKGLESNHGFRLREQEWEVGRGSSYVARFFLFLSPVIMTTTHCVR